jgi:hypothetical protein
MKTPPEAESGMKIDIPRDGEYGQPYSEGRIEYGISSWRYQGMGWRILDFLLLLQERKIAYVPAFSLCPKWNTRRP